MLIRKAGARLGWVVDATPKPLYLRERDPVLVGLDGCGKSRFSLDSIPGPVAPRKFLSWPVLVIFEGRQMGHTLTSIEYDGNILRWFYSGVF
jgi:hypothetical protein